MSVKKLALFYGDTHLRDTSSYPPFNRKQSNGLSGELNNIITGFEFIRDLILQHEPTLVVNLGDIYHMDDYISVLTIHAASIGLAMVKEACDKVGAKHIIVAGNHDTYIESVGDSEIRITAIRSLCGYGQVLDCNQTYSHNGMDIFIMPHTDSIDKAYEGIMIGSSHDLIITHLDFMGAVYENHQQAPTSLDPNTAVPVISGHIHLKQTVGKVHYPGSVIQRTFSRTSLEDVGGALLWDLHKNRPATPVIANTYSRHYVKITDIGQIASLDPERCILKIMLDMPKQEVEHLLKDYDYIYLQTKHKQEDTKVIYIRSEVDKPEVLLRTFIAENRPEALTVFDDNIGGNSNEQKTA